MFRTEIVEKIKTHILCSVTFFSPWAGHVARMGEERGACRVLVGKQEGKRPLG